MEFLNDPTRVLFFTGKGGVGKTSVACATAVKLADAGKRVLLISTDPASNLDEVLGVTLGNAPTAVPGVPNLKAMNIDPEASAKAYRESMVAPYRGVLPDAAVASMEEQFSGSCTLEIAAFDEFARLLGGTGTTADFDHVLFDTAPTGHTLRLLSLPSAWDGFLSANTTGTSCLGPLAGLQAQQKLYADTVKALGDPEDDDARAGRPAGSGGAPRGGTDERRTGRARRSQPAPRRSTACSGRRDRADPIARAMERRAEKAVSLMPVGLAHLPRTVIPLAPHGLVGIEAVRAMGADHDIAIAVAAGDARPGRCRRSAI